MKNRFALPGHCFHRWTTRAKLSRPRSQRRNWFWIYSLEPRETIRFCFRDESSVSIPRHDPSTIHTVPYTIFTLFYRYYPRIGETEKRFSRFSPRRLLSNASLTHQQWTLNSDSPMFDEEMTRMRDKLASLVFKAALTVSKLPLPGRV